MTGRRESHEIDASNGILTNGVPGLGVANGAHEKPGKAVSVTFKDDIQMDIIASRSTITAENPGLPQSPNSHGGRVARSRAGSTISIDTAMLRSYKLIVIFGICFIIGLFSLPVIFYYTESSSEANNLSTCGNGANISKSDMLEDCGYEYSLNSTCVNKLLDLYKALDLVNNCSTFCMNMTQTLFCKALSNCDNASFVNNLMCQEVRQDYCTSEWRMLELNEAEELIDCDEYGETAPLNCSEQFGLNGNGSICSPLCENFSQHDEVFTAIYIYMFSVLTVISIVGGIIVLIASIWKRKKMFKFPQILILFGSMAITIQSILLFISNFSVGRWDLICSRKFTFQALTEPSVFCQIQGCIALSAIILYSLFWFIFILHLYIRVTFPFQSIKLDKSEHSKKYHIIEIVCALIVGTVPYIAFAATYKFQAINFPPSYCVTEPTYNFYGSIVPTVVVNCANLILMLFVMYKIHKQKYRKTTGISFSTPEVKIFLVFCYLLVFMVMLWTSFSIENGRFNTTLSYMLDYIKCMSGGMRKGLDCKRYRQRFLDRGIPGLQLTYLILYTFLTFSNLPFIVQFQSVKFFVSRKMSVSSKRSSSMSLKRSCNL